MVYGTAWMEICHSNVGKIVDGNIFNNEMVLCTPKNRHLPLNNSWILNRKIVFDINVEMRKTISFM